ncbi:MAG TPA: DapH/DapD/GlmU-related protein, partial [Gemmataceae bacterium]
MHNRIATVMGTMFRAANGIVQLLALPVLAALLLAALLRFGGLAAHLTPLVLIVSAPVLYFAWLLVYLVLCALQIQLLFWRFAKPRRFTYKLDSPEALRLFPLLVCYSHVGIIRSLPMGRVLLSIPLVRGLALLACAPRYRLGKQVLIGTFLYDPDLTEIGNNAVVGAGSVLSAHAITTTRNGEFVYVSAPIRIGDRAVVGGEARIALGAQVGEDALVEPFSNVLPFTIIPPEEVWGGNPAVFLRKRESPPAHGHAVPNAPKCVRPSVDASLDSAEARRLVVQALNLPAIRATAKKPLDADTCAEWDSLGQLALAAALHTAHGWRYTPQQVAELRSLAAVEAAIREARGETTSAPEETTLSLPADPEWLPLLPSDRATRLLAQASASVPIRDVVDVVIAASFTAEPMAAALRPWCAAFGIEARVAFCGYNQITQALLAPDSLFRAHEGGLNVVLLRPDDLPGSAAATEAAHALLDAIRQFTRESGGSCTLAVGTLPPPLSSAFAGSRLKVDALRADWTRQLTEIAGVELFDFAGVIERMGLEAAGDAALEAAARAPFSAAAYRELGIE